MYKRHMHTHADMHACTHNYRTPYLSCMTFPCNTHWQPEECLDHSPRPVELNLTFLFLDTKKNNKQIRKKKKKSYMAYTVNKNASAVMKLLPAACQKNICFSVHGDTATSICMSSLIPIASNIKCSGAT